METADGQIQPTRGTRLLVESMFLGVTGIIHEGPVRKAVDERRLPRWMNHKFKCFEREATLAPKGSHRMHMSLQGTHLPSPRYGWDLVYLHIVDRPLHTFSTGTWLDPQQTPQRFIPGSTNKLRNDLSRDNFRKENDHQFVTDSH